SLVVDTAVDENDGNYAAGDLSLREAIGLANGSIGPDIITFSPAINGQPILLTQGQLEISDSVIITGNGPANTIIDGQQNSRVFDVLATGGDVTFNGVTITNGKITDQIGGGINSDSPGTLTILNSTLSHNTSAGSDPRGGGMATTGPLVVTNSV